LAKSQSVVQKMKILTNIQTSYLAGIGQAFWALVDSLAKNKRNDVEIVGIRVISDPNVSSKGIFSKKKLENFSLLSLNGKDLPDFKKVIMEVNTIEEIKEYYKSLVEGYRKIIKSESPDLILINGTYYIPWILFVAAVSKKLPVVLHYHGILSKEVSHWPDKPRLLMEKLEKTFDNDRLFYLFPSELAKKTVEKEVFGHKISKSAIIPNPVPNHFFDIKEIGVRQNVGFVGRWSKIKNLNFVKRLARYSQKKKSFKINMVTDPEMAKKAMRKNLKWVKLIKPMENYKLAGFYAKMGIVLSPSHFETYGNVPQEAIATGTPALVNPNMGVAETFINLGLKDWIIDFDSVGRVYKKIEEFSGSEVSMKVREGLRQMVSGEKISYKIIETLKRV